MSLIEDALELLQGEIEKISVELLQGEIEKISERDLAKTPAAALRAFSRLARYQSRDENIESEAQPKSLMIQLVALDLKRIEEAKTPESAARAYFMLSHTMIRLARTLITEP